MTKKYFIIIFAAYTFILLLCGCAQPDTIHTNETVENIFNAPTETTETLATKPARVSIAGISSFGYENGLMDDFGTYYLYKGGEMCFPFCLSVEGLEEEGVGMILFFDGRPQSYHTDFDETNRYMHTIYPPDIASGSFNLYFVPQPGQTGDTKTMDFLLVPHPGQSASDTSGGMRFLGLRRGVVSRLIFEADSPDVDLIPVTERVLDWTAELQDLTSSEIALWSSEDYQTKVEAIFSVNGKKQFGSVTGYDEPTIHFQLELKGSPDAEYALTVFVNNQPVSVSPDNSIYVSTENGQKMVVNMTLDVSDLDGNVSVYAVLSPTVYRTDGWDDNHISDYFFFTR